MLGHLVLFELKPELAAASRERFHDTLQAALDAIPSVRGVRLGRQVHLGAGYEPTSSEGYTYFALLEFDDADGLRAYLEHPLHAELGALFWQCSARTLVSDFELAGSDRRETLRLWL